MAEFSAENSSVGEDWESECYDSAAWNEVEQISRGVCRLMEDRSSDHDDVSEHHLAPSDLSSSYTDKSVYVNDRKKVFVSNVNYRVGLLHIYYILYYTVDNALIVNH